MPKLGESVTGGTVARWLKREGERVEQFDALAEIVTDKVTAEIPADCTGILQSILVAENETVAVGTLLAVIAEDAADVAAPAESSQDQARMAEGASAPPETALQATEQAEKADAIPDPADGRSVRAAQQTAQQAVAPDADRSGAASDAGQSIGTAIASAARHSPVVSRLAAEHGVDLARIAGTGIGGRIMRKDVLRHIEQAATEKRPLETGDDRQAAEKEERRPTVSGASAVSELPAVSGQAPAIAEQDAREEWIPVTPLRRTIARRMVQSKRDAPHAWMMVEADVTGMHRLREREKATFKSREGVDLTYFPFFLKAVAAALRQHPLLNAVWAEDRILLKRDIHLSIAVATDETLAVPVIHHADRLSVAGLSLAVHDLARRARTGKLTVSDVEGGTFTVNNTGAFRSILSQPIINAPQAAILSVETIVKRPIVQADDSIAIRHMVNLCLSIDHRVLDGLAAGRFMQAVKERIEAIREQTSLY